MLYHVFAVFLQDRLFFNTSSVKELNKNFLGTCSNVKVNINPCMAAFSENHWSDSEKAFH